jgi:hypothetical protein
VSSILKYSQIILVGIICYSGVKSLKTNTKKPEIPATNGIGEIKAYSHTTLSQGLFALVSENQGVTAAHILDGAQQTFASIEGKDYKIIGWKRINNSNDFPNNDFAIIELDTPPPKNLTRYPLNNTPANTQTPFHIAHRSNNAIEIAEKTLTSTKSYTLTSNTPRKIYQGLLWLNNDPISDSTPLNIGDSGGPWIQNGKIIGVTSSFQTLARSPSTQILYASSHQNSPQERGQVAQNIAYKPLLIASISLLTGLTLIKKKDCRK